MNFIDHSTPPTHVNFYNPNDEETTYTYQILKASNIINSGDKVSPRTKLIEAGHWRNLKTWLALKSDGKCWFCEAKENRATYDVEHFRPKNQVKVNKKVLKFPVSHNRSGEIFDGYWWLSYDWTNYRLSCQRCNRLDTDSITSTVHGKGNEFPLIDENQRCWDETFQLNNEQPYLLDPCNQSDTYLLLHPRGGSVFATHSDTNCIDHHRAQFTISLLGLNAYRVKEKKLEIQNTLECILEQQIGKFDLPIKVQNEIFKRLCPCSEYYSFSKSIILEFREDIPWLENQLTSMGL